MTQGLEQQQRQRRRLLGVAIALLLVCAAGPILLAQAAAAAGADSTAMPVAGQVDLSVVWAFFSSAALEWAKRSPLVGVLSPRTTFYAQRLLGFGVALAAATGIHFAFNGHDGTLSVTGLLWPGIWPSLRQWVFQELTYRMAVKGYSSSASPLPTK